MSLDKCEICRGYFREAEGHRCHGLRTVDWVCFLQELRAWADSDPYAKFEIYYRSREQGEL